MNRLIQILLICYVGLVLINSLLLPPIDFMSIDNLLFPFAFVAIVFQYRSNKAFQWSLLIVSISLLTGLISNYLSGGLTFNELFWLLRIVKTLTVGWAVYYLVNNHPSVFNTMLFTAFIGFSIINALQLLEWEFILELYASNQNSIDVLNNSYLDSRIFGVTTNPNSNGLILALFGFYYFMSNEKNKYYLIALASVLLLMTQSRTVFVAFALTIMIVVLVQLVNRNRKYLLLFIAGSVLSLLLIVNLKLTNLSSLFNGKALSSNSVTTRFKMFDEVIHVNKNTSLFGKGKLSNIPELIGGSIDNEFIYLYIEYGVVGLMILLITVVFLSVLSIKLNPYNLGLLLIMLICGLTNLTFSNLEVSAIFILLFSASFLKNKKVNA